MNFRAQPTFTVVDRLVWPLWFAASLTAIFLTGLMPLFSTRTMGVAWEMWQSGQFILPLSNGEPYSHKTPLLFWLIEAGWWFGDVNDIWPRVLEVLCGLGVLLLARRLAQRLFPEAPRVARLTPWLLAAFSYAFLFSLQIMYEVLLSLCVLAALDALVGRNDSRKPYFVYFALAVGAGLMTKGPVALLHVVFPFLFGPWWHPWAARRPLHWYVAGSLALLAALGILLVWATSAAQLGGEAYGHALFFTQTTGRLVNAFDHARPWWWYLSVLPALLLPWLLWPRAWAALLPVLVHRGSAGSRFLACWLWPMLLAFSMVSGKQLYYLLPELAGAAMLLASGFARARHRDREPSRWSGPWPLALALLVGAGVLLYLRWGAAREALESSWMMDLGAASPLFAVLAVVLALCLLFAPRDDGSLLRSIAAVSIVAVLAAYAVLAQTVWMRFDLRPAAAHIAVLQEADIPVAHFEPYENQFQFLGRLQKPLDVVVEPALAEWASTHAGGRVIRYPRNLHSEDLVHAELIQPFRSGWLLIERADSWLARQQGTPLAPLATPAMLYPPHYWRYRVMATTADAG